MVSIAPAAQQPNPTPTAALTWHEASPNVRVATRGDETVRVFPSTAEAGGLWTVVAEHVTLSARDEAAALDLVNRTASRLAPADSLVAALERMQERDARARWRDRMSDAILEGPFAGGTRTPPSVDARRNVEALGRLLRRLGWSIGPDGRALELWRERARGRWIRTPWWPGPTDGIVRVEGGQVLEIYPSESIENGWCVAVGERSPTRLRAHLSGSLAHAKAYAVSLVTRSVARS